MMTEPTDVFDFKTTLFNVLNSFAPCLPTAQISVNHFGDVVLHWGKRKSVNISIAPNGDMCGENPYYSGMPPDFNDMTLFATKMMEIIREVENPPAIKRRSKKCDQLVKAQA